MRFRHKTLPEGKRYMGSVVPTPEDNTASLDQVLEPRSLDQVAIRGADQKERGLWGGERTEVAFLNTCAFFLT